MNEKRRVVITGLGIVSCLGNSLEEVNESLKQGKSGINFVEEYKEMGLRSQIAGQVDIDLAQLIDRKELRFMGEAAAYCYLSMQQAIADAGLTDEMVSNIRSGLITGSGSGSPKNQDIGINALKTRGIRRVGPFMVPRIMSSTTSACLANSFKIKGLNYSITAACATSAHCIGVAMEQIQMGKQDIIFSGGGEEETWHTTLMFDAMGALSTKYNDTPEKASRPYDATRDGFVAAGGGAMLVLEELEHARARGAKFYAELVGYGATSDGHDMVQPSGEGAVRCMQQALETVDTPIDYINTHGTSTPAGDIVELKALRTVFGDAVPPLSSTKALSGHSLGAISAQEAIFSLLMMENDYICASANINELDPGAVGFPIVRERRDNVKLKTVLSNSFGFGGTNSTLIFRKLED